MSILKQPPRVRRLTPQSVDKALLAAYRHLGLFRRINEAVSLDYMLPMRILQSGGSTDAAPIESFSLRDNAKLADPFPVGFHIVNKNADSYQLEGGEWKYKEGQLEAIDAQA